MQGEPESSAGKSGPVPPDLGSVCGMPCRRLPCGFQPGFRCQTVRGVGLLTPVLQPRVYLKEILGEALGKWHFLMPGGLTTWLVWWSPGVREGGLVKH